MDHIYSPAGATEILTHWKHDAKCKPHCKNCKWKKKRTIMKLKDCIISESER
jgi:hypothetical protein